MSIYRSELRYEFMGKQVPYRSYIGDVPRSMYTVLGQTYHAKQN